MAISWFFSDWKIVLHSSVESLIDVSLSWKNVYAVTYSVDIQGIKQSLQYLRYAFSIVKLSLEPSQTAVLIFLNTARNAITDSFIYRSML